MAGILVGLGAAGIVLAADLLFTMSSRGSLHPLQTVELKTYDWRLSHTARPDTARSKQTC